MTEKMTITWDVLMEQEGYVYDEVARLHLANVFGQICRMDTEQILLPVVTV